MITVGTRFSSDMIGIRSTSFVVDGNLRCEDGTDSSGNLESLIDGEPFIFGRPRVIYLFRLRWVKTVCLKAW
jgi:hypothetical protein